MILIGGTKLTPDKLPYWETMNYTIENKQGVLEIKLKTVAKQSTCFQIYLHSSLKDLSLTPDVEQKTKYFSSDDQLKKMLNTGGKDEPEPEVPESPVIPDVALPVFATPDPSAMEMDKSVEPVPIEVPSKGYELIIEEADTTIPETLLQIPNINESIDNVKSLLNTKDKIILQKDSMLKDAKREMDDLYRIQEIELMEMREGYEGKIQEANSVIQSLKEKVKEVSVPPELQGFLKYATYSQNHKASLREGFTAKELKELGRLTSDIHILASGSGESLHNMLNQVTGLVNKKAGVVIADFSNDLLLNLRYKLKTNDSTMMLRDDTIPITQIAKDINGVKYIPTTFYNDIALLGFDWVKVLKRLMEYASGRPIILLFNNINSFAVRYTASKLATIGKFHIFVKSNPVILSTLFGDIAFIPEDRFTVVALDFIEVLEPVLKQLHTRYKLKIFKEGPIPWKEIGLKV